MKRLSILGSTMGTPAEFRTVIRLLGEGRLRPVIHAVLPLAEARRALENGGDDLVTTAEALRMARAAFDRLSGRAGIDDMLDALFGRFCLGK